MRVSSVARRQRRQPVRYDARPDRVAHGHDLTRLGHAREPPDPGDVELEGETAYLYVLKAGRRDHEKGPALQARMSENEQKHLVRAGAWWRIPAEQKATG